MEALKMDDMPVDEHETTEKICLKRVVEIQEDFAFYTECGTKFWQKGKRNMLWLFVENVVQSWIERSFALLVLLLLVLCKINLMPILLWNHLKSRVMKKVVTGIVAMIIVFFIIGQFIFTVDKPCDWCGSSPSVAYELNDGSYSYVCKECSEFCFWCENKATIHYENLAGIMAFVCDDCYEGWKQYSNW